MIIGQITIIILAIIGFAVSFHIHYHKTRDIHLSCIVGQKDCGKVVNSKYNTFLKVHNEVWGMVYYGFIALIYFIALSFPIFQIGQSITIIAVITGGAALFSVYLTLVQIFTIKEYCEWCLVSAGLSILIFVLFLI
jgi:uncharacterized membrane protein